jgi:hypothetical protein
MVGIGTDFVWVRTILPNWWTLFARSEFSWVACLIMWRFSNTLGVEFRKWCVAAKKHLRAATAKTNL